MYEIKLGDETVGNASITKQGLYYRIRCTCKISTQIMYEIIATCNDKKIDLGVCVPIENGFGLVTNIPAKQLSGGEISFHLIPRHTALSGKFVPIRADEPFAYLQYMENAFLSRMNGSYGAIIQDADRTSQ